MTGHTTTLAQSVRIYILSQDIKGVLEYVHMYANDVRSANAIFGVPLISNVVFTCIRMRFVSSDGRFASPMFLVGERKICIRTHICIDFCGGTERI